MGKKFLFDEGISHNFATGLHLTGKDVEHVLDTFKPGTKDEVWLEYAGKNKLAVILKDKGIRRRPNEKALLVKYGVVAFYLGGSESSGHDMLLQLAKAWNKMEQKAKQHYKKGIAAAFIIRPRGGKIDEIPLT
jgi:hypothetical protein